MDKKILIVDDSEASRNSLGFSLKMKGYEVLQAEDGLDALTHLERTEDVDLIITDLNMPNMNGMELIKKIRQTKNYKFTPILVISSEKEEVEKTMAAGASGWLIKSAKISTQLEDAINKLI